MDIKYIMMYVLMVIGCYVSEFIILGIWYQMCRKSNIGYFTFLRKMLDYYHYVLLHLPHFLEGRKTDAPGFSSLQWLFAILIPIVLPSFMLINTSWIYRIAVFALVLYVLFEKIFKEGKVEASVQIDKWVRFLFNAEDCPERYASPENREISGTEGNQPLSKEEIRINRIFGCFIAAVSILLLIILVLGTISDLKNEFHFSTNPFIFFGDANYNTIFIILLAVDIMAALCFVFWTPQDRAEAKAQASNKIKQEAEKAANYLGLNKGIIIDPRLKEWEQSIIRMCNVLGIRRAAIVSEYICEDNMSGKVALSAKSSEGIPTVVISTREIDRQRTKYTSQVVHDMIRFLLGHELTHIRYQDYNIGKLGLKEAGCLCLTMIVFWGGMMVSLHMPESMKNIGIACQIALAGSTMISFRMFVNNRYWRYVSEYRADRISASISGASDEAIAAMLNLYAEEEQTVMRQKKRKTSQFHPEMKSRLKELKRKKKWGFSEYFRYAFKLIL